MNNTWKWFEEYENDCWYSDIVASYEESKGEKDYE